MDRRVALVTPCVTYVGPELARVLAARGHDLVLGDPSDELVAELLETGVDVEAVSDVADLAAEGVAQRLVDAGLARFGRIDAACMSSGQIVVGRFLDSDIEQLRQCVTGNIEAPYRFLTAMLPPMVAAGDGQIVVITSAAGARPTRGAPLYSATRAGATMLVRNVAEEHAGSGVQVNAVGSNFMDFPEFLAGNRVDSPERRAKLESRVPMGRLGTMSELAHFCAVLLDGTSRFQTGQFFSYSGGWST